MALSGVFRHPFPLSPVPLQGQFDLDSPGALTPRLLPSIILCLSSYADPCLPISLMTRDGVIFAWFSCLVIFVPLENFSIICRRHHCRWRTAYLNINSGTVCHWAMKVRIPGKRDTYHPLTWSSPWHPHCLPSVCHTSRHYLSKDIGQRGDRIPISHMRGER